MAVTSAYKASALCFSISRSAMSFLDVAVSMLQICMSRAYICRRRSAQWAISLVMSAPEPEAKGGGIQFLLVGWGGLGALPSGRV